jgi:hypothetical protein
MIPVVDKYNAIYVVTDAPSGLEFGIDCITYETGPGLSAIYFIFIHGIQKMKKFYRATICPAIL